MSQSPSIGQSVKIQMEGTENKIPWGVKLIILGVAALVALMIAIAISPFTIISAGERGVVLRWGKVDRVLSEGVHWITPIVEDVEKLDVRIQKEEVDATAASKDLQSVSTKIALNYNLQPDKVGDLWTSIGKDYKNRILDPAIQESVKAATAKYTAEELITKRESVRDAIRTSLKERLSAENINVVEVSIVNFDFSADFNRAIELKVKAEQDALTAKNTLEKVKFEAEQKIAQAQAEAQSIKLQSEAAQNQKYVELKAIDVQMEFAKRWSGKYPDTYIVNSGTNSAPLPIITLPTVK